MNYPNTLSSPKKPLLLIAAILGIGLSMSLVASPLRGYASTGGSTTTYPMFSGIQYSFVQGTQSTNSYFDVTLLAWANSPVAVPSNVNVNYWVTFDGNVFYNHACSLSYAPEQLSNSCSFAVPFQGLGVYWAHATFSDNNGNIVAQAIIDPLIEPEWI